MSAYNFQRQFAEAIRSGTKPHTIRARRKNGYVPMVGECIKLYTGMRTPRCELLREVEVTRVRPIQISTTYISGRHTAGIVLDGVPLEASPAERLAKADGFASLTKFAEFFRDKHGEWFAGYLIEWRR